MRHAAGGAPVAVNRLCIYTNINTKNVTMEMLYTKTFPDLFSIRRR
jgi:hypothetical protein